MGLVRNGEGRAGFHPLYLVPTVGLFIGVLIGAPFGDYGSLLGLPGTTAGWYAGRRWAVQRGLYAIAKRMWVAAVLSVVVFGAIVGSVVGVMLKDNEAAPEAGVQASQEPGLSDDVTDPEATPAPSLEVNSPGDCASLPAMPPADGSNADTPSEVAAQWSAIADLAFSKAEPAYLKCVHSFQGSLYENHLSYILDHPQGVENAFELKARGWSNEWQGNKVIMVEVYSGGDYTERALAHFSLHSGYWLLESLAPP